MDVVSGVFSEDAGQESLAEAGLASLQNTGQFALKHPACLKSLMFFSYQQVMDKENS